MFVRSIIVALTAACLTIPSTATATVPQLLNPSFATDTAAWTVPQGGTVTRDTNTFHSNPASGRWSSVLTGPGASLTGRFDSQFPSGFPTGPSYWITFAIRASEPGNVNVAIGTASGTVPVTTAWLNVTMLFSRAQALIVKFVLSSATTNAGAAMPAVYVDSLEVFG